VGAFIVAGASNQTVKVANYDPTVDPGTMGAWRTIADFSQFIPNQVVDKPWIVNRGGEELAVVFYHGQYYPGSDYGYCRSSDGGANWTTADVLPDGAEVSGRFCAQPAVGADGKLYVAYVAGPCGEGTPTPIRFLVGRSGTNNTINFRTLKQLDGNPLQVFIRVCGESPLPVIPAPGLVAKAVPYLVGDPSNANRLYLIYHDYTELDPSDMNIYCVRLDNDGLGNWSSGVAQRVNNDAPPDGTQPDQFIPAAAVDTQGRVHVIFYDNREVCPGTCGTSTVQYDEYYALSTDHGASFTNYSLRIPALDPHAVSFTAPSNLWYPREYNGITAVDTPGQTKIWIAYAGKNETNITQVIYGNTVTIIQ
jgi:hypothetical protein